MYSSNLTNANFDVLFKFVGIDPKSVSPGAYEYLRSHSYIIMLDWASDAHSNNRNKTTISYDSVKGAQLIGVSTDVPNVFSSTKFKPIVLKALAKSSEIPERTYRIGKQAVDAAKLYLTSFIVQMLKDVKEQSESKDDHLAILLNLS